MKDICIILLILLCSFSCAKKEPLVQPNPILKQTGATSKKIDQEPIERLSFKNVSDIVNYKSYSTWVKFPDSSASLALHFRYKDTLAISYSPECWLMFPYKLDKDKIIVYWDKNIDTKYNFEIVKAVNKTSDKLVGTPFMNLKLVNDTTLTATYPNEKLIREINNSSKERTFFTPDYILAQDGFL